MYVYVFIYVYMYMLVYLFTPNRGHSLFYSYILQSYDQQKIFIRNENAIVVQAINKIYFHQ